MSESEQIQKLTARIRKLEVEKQNLMQQAAAGDLIPSNTKFVNRYHEPLMQDLKALARLMAEGPDNWEQATADLQRIIKEVKDRRKKYILQNKL